MKFSTATTFLIFALAALESNSFLLESICGDGGGNDEDRVGGVPSTFPSTFPSTTPSMVPSTNPSVVPTQMEVQFVSKLVVCDIDTGDLLVIELDQETGEAATMTTIATGDIKAVAVDYTNERIYYGTAFEIYACDFDGSNSQTVTSEYYASGMAIDAAGEKLYWTMGGQYEEVRRVDLNGSNMETLFYPSSDFGSDSACGVAIDESNSKLYVTTYNGKDIIQSNLDGTDAQVIVENAGSQGVGIAVGGDQLFFGMRNDYVFTSNLDGSNVTSLVADQNQVQGVVVDPVNERVYWTAGSPALIASANYDGSAVRTIANSTFLSGSPWHIQILEF